jgi:hypothetical protein
MNKIIEIRELTQQEQKKASGGWGVTWGKAKEGNGWYVQGFLGKKPGKG